MKRFGTILLILLMVLALAALPLVAGCAVEEEAEQEEEEEEEETAAEFFQGKTITIVSPFDPSSGFAVVARTLAPFLEERTGAKVIVECKEGAGGIIAYNYLYGAEPDGLTLLIPHFKVVTFDILGKGMECTHMIGQKGLGESGGVAGYSAS